MADALPVQPALQTTLQPGTSPDLSNRSLEALNDMVKTRDPNRVPFTCRAAALSYLASTSQP